MNRFAYWSLIVLALAGVVRADPPTIEDIERNTEVIRRLSTLERKVEDLSRRVDSGWPIPAETKEDARYEWRATPNGHQALMRNDRQIGVWMTGDGYYPLISPGKWGAKTLPPIEAPSRPTGHATQFGRTVSRAASPFAGWPLPSAGEAADGSIQGRGPWPDGLEFPAGMRRYKRAAWAQSVAHSGSQPIIDRVSRLNIASKWRQSGGLDGIAGWRSDLYRNETAAATKPFTGYVTVKNGGRITNSFGRDLGEATQDELSWQRKYPDGARFLDVLSTSKGVFEVRQREKRDGRWISLVTYRDKAARPKGYEGLPQGMTCVGCHNTTDGPGTGGYGVALVPGSDTIFSDGFSVLEQ